MFQPGTKWNYNLIIIFLLMVIVSVVSIGMFVSYRGEAIRGRSEYVAIAKKIQTIQERIKEKTGILQDFGSYHVLSLDGKNWYEIVKEGYETKILAPRPGLIEKIIAIDRLFSGT